jgi:hypothetical protein
MPWERKGLTLHLSLSHPHACLSTSLHFPHEKLLSSFVLCQDPWRRAGDTKRRGEKRIRERGWTNYRYVVASFPYLLSENSVGKP